jgi:hypothetical protein
MRQWQNKSTFLLLALPFFAYVVIRAWLLSITFDEAYMYLYFIDDTYANIFNYTFLTANNHVLITLANKFLVSIFPVSEFLLRVPSLIGYIIFLLYSWAILGGLKNRYFRTAAFLFVNLNPFVIDFFSIARGYGLGMGAMTAALFYCIRYYSGDKKYFPGLILSILFGSISVLSNFSYLNFFIPLLILLSILTLVKYFDNRITKSPGATLRLIAAWLLSFIFLAVPVLLYSWRTGNRLKEANQLFYGGDKSFWQDTVGSLVSSTLYGKSYEPFWTFILKAIIIVVTATSLVYALILIAEGWKKIRANGAFLIMLSLLLLSIGCSLLMHHLAGTRFLIERTALLYVIYFQLIVCYWGYYLFRLNKWLAVLPAVLFALAVFHFTGSINLSYTKDWKNNAGEKQMMKDLGKNADPGKTGYLMAEMSDLQTSQFYIHLYHYDWLSTKYFPDSIPKEDFAYYPAADTSRFLAMGFKKIGEYPVNGYVLFKHLHNTHPVIFDTVLAMPSCTGSSPGNLCLDGKTAIVLEPGVNREIIKIPASSWYKGDPDMVAHISFAYFAPHGDHDASVDLQMCDSQGTVYKTLDYDLFLRDLKPASWNLLNYAMQLTDTKSPRYYVVLKILNHAREKVYLSDLKVRISE